MSHLTLLILSAVTSDAGIALVQEDSQFAEKISFSAQNYEILRAAPSRSALECRDGAVLDWSEYTYQNNQSWSRFTDSNRWRCVRRVTKESHVTPFDPDAPQKGSRAAKTHSYSNVVTAGYLNFKKVLDRQSPTLIWQVSDDILVTYLHSAWKKTDEFGRLLWDLSFEKYSLSVRREARSSLLLYGEDFVAQPVVRMFHVKDGDLLIVRAQKRYGDFTTFIVFLDFALKEVRPYKRDDENGLDAYVRTDYTLVDGVLWERIDRRTSRNQTFRSIQYAFWQNDYFTPWTQYEHGTWLKPPPPPPEIMVGLPGPSESSE